MEAVKTFFILQTSQTLCDQNGNAFSLKQKKCKFHYIFFFHCEEWISFFVSDEKLLQSMGKILCKMQRTAGRIWSWRTA